LLGWGSTRKDGTDGKTPKNPAGENHSLVRAGWGFMRGRRYQKSAENVESAKREN